MLNKCSTRIMKDGILLDVANKNLVCKIKDTPNGPEIIEWRTTLSAEELENEQPRKPEPVNPDGPGSIFADWLATIGIEKKEGCGCSATQTLMDREGPKWCEDNITRLCLQIEYSLEDLKDAAKEEGRLGVMLKLYNRKVAKVAILAACKESRKRKAAADEGG